MCTHAYMHAPKVARKVHQIPWICLTWVLGTEY